MPAIGLNHVSIHARDLEASTRFYEEFLGCRRVPTPDFGYPVQWLELGELQLHLFVRPGTIGELQHFAVDVDDFEATYAAARRLGIVDGGPRQFPDGGVQLYVRDPAGNRVEVDWPDASTLDAGVRAGLEIVPGPAGATLYTGRPRPSHAAS